MIAACITTRNEAGTIGTLVSTLADHGYYVIVIDAASTDGTPDVAAKAGARRVWASPSRLPIGPALMQGWRLARAEGADRLFQIDAGGSHDPLEADRLLRCDADLVIGSRFRSGSQYIGNRKRAIMSKAMAIACNLAQSGAHHTDWTSGYRAFRAPLLDALLDHNFRATMHTWQAEVLALAGSLGFTIAEAPITYIAGRSSFRKKMIFDVFAVLMEMMHHIGPVRKD